MCFAWGLLAPVGIFIAMFYKVVWPNGEWFYVSIHLFKLKLVFHELGSPTVPLVLWVPS